MKIKRLKQLVKVYGVKRNVDMIRAEREALHDEGKKLALMGLSAMMKDSTEDVEFIGKRLDEITERNEEIHKELKEAEKFMKNEVKKVKKEKDE